MQGQRIAGVEWFYKQFDTSLMCTDPKGKRTPPLPLDNRMLFKAGPDDNDKFNKDLDVSTFNKYAHLFHTSCRYFMCMADLKPGHESVVGCLGFWLQCT